MTRFARNCLLFALSACCAAFVAYRVAIAADTQANPPFALKGTYLLDIKGGPQMSTGVDNPTTVSIAGKTFLRGTVSGDAGGMLQKTSLSGNDIYIAMDEIISMREVKTK